MDRQANDFALALLMPEETFIPACKEMDLSSDEKMKEIMKQFGVTATAVAARLVMLAKLNKI